MCEGLIWRGAGMRAFLVGENMDGVGVGTEKIKKTGLRGKIPWWGNGAGFSRKAPRQLFPCDAMTMQYQYIMMCWATKSFFFFLVFTI